MEFSLQSLNIGQAINAIEYLSTSSFVFNSFLSQYIRTVAPLPRGKVQEAEKEEYRASFLKEISATQGEDRPNEVDWSVFLYEDLADRRCHPLIPARYAVQYHTARGYQELYHILQTKLFYPRYSRRHVSKETAAEMGFATATGVDVERFYSEHGVHPGGRMEVRSTWKFNDLTPRTYFAMGGIVYSASKYMQEIFMLLVDHFTVTHRKGRFDVHRLSFDDSEDVWVYDYSNFTSNMTEQKYFVAELAGFFDGCMINVFDTRFGPVSRNLGDMLKTYNDVCNTEPEFYIGPQLRRLLSIEAGSYVHRKAGALGIYGNIASCTLGHGHVTASIAGGTDKAVVVGDDGTVIVPRPDPKLVYERGMIDEPLTTLEMTKNALRVLGDIADLKFAILTGTIGARFWTFLKRSYERSDYQMILGDQLHLVNLVLTLRGSGSTRAKNTLSQLDSIAEGYSLAMSLWSLYLRVYRLCDEYSDEDLKDLAAIVSAVYREFRLPAQGSPHGFKMTIGAHKSGRQALQGQAEYDVWVPTSIPPSIRVDQFYLFREGPFSLLSTTCHGMIFRSKRNVYRPRGTAVISVMQNTYGSIMEGFGSRYLNLLVDLGYLLKEEIVEEVEMTVDDFVSFAAEFVYNRSMLPVFRYEVIRPVPSHLFVDTLSFVSQ